MDLELPELDKVPQSVAQAMGYRIIEHRFDFFGVCPQCQAA
jgi:Fe2+ or Zn2+ uptake regulation protein